MNGLTFRAVRDEGDGAALAPIFQSRWPNYLRWYLSEGDRARPNYAECARQLKAHMPELVPAWERLTEQLIQHIGKDAGGGDLIARFLSLWNPPAFISGCTQAVWTRERPALIRNYDYPPELCDATLLHAKFGGLRTMAMSDCLWGVLDGINERGLCVSLAFGGRRSRGEGFGIVIVLRYILETCETAAQALKVLQRVPVHLPYNLEVLDRAGDWRTIFISPDRAPEVRREPYSANRQDATVLPEDASVLDTVRREALLENVMGNPNETRERLLERFTEPPIYRPVKPGDWGTLYTACYRPEMRSVELRWRNTSWSQSIGAFTPGTITAVYS
jgi:predicted choloylglycine hydrolase